MPRLRLEKESVNLCLRVSKDVSDAINKMAEETGMSKTAIVEKSAMEYIDRYQKTGKIRP